MDYRIFNVRTDVNACNCTQGCTDKVRESALKVDCGRKIPCSSGESNPCWRCASQMLYQLSYIPTIRSWSSSLVWKGKVLWRLSYKVSKMLLQLQLRKCNCKVWIEWLVLYHFPTCVQTSCRDTQQRFTSISARSQCQWCRERRRRWSSGSTHNSSTKISESGVHAAMPFAHQRWD